jgi:hypothetical protein
LNGQGDKYQFENKSSDIKNELNFLQYFMSHFKQTVLSIEGSHTMYDISLSIQGYGDFSGPCASMMQPREVKEMFSTILQRAEEFLK